MLRTYRTFLILAALGVVACGPKIEKFKGSPPGGNNGTTNNGANNGTANNGGSNNGGSNNAARCGDGVLDPGELCDPAIAEGPGACPTACQATACSTAMLVGEASACTAQCLTEPVACADGDGCCPAGCESATDGDCTNQCGDGVTEGPELCDGNCPSSCSDGDACTTDRLRGGAQTCDAECQFELVTACVDGDGCCPASCTAAYDDDCEPTATCGDGVVDDGETCDGNCPASCDDANACTTDTRNGAAASCNVQCSHTAISTCANGDGCCPAGCTNQNDDDCACVPKTCAELGAQCGSVSNGCGQTMNCTNTCTSMEVCTQNKCVEQSQIGKPCMDYPECGSSPNAACILPPAWPDGYCSIICSNDTCPAGSHCASLDDTDQLCMLDCTSDANCRPGYQCRDFDGRGTKECAPPPAATVDAGDACTSDGQCPQGYTCETQVENSGVYYTMPGGACTAQCIAIFLSCPDNQTVCGNENWCMPLCTTDADCRPDYYCALGVFTGGNYCWPRP